MDASIIAALAGAPASVVLAYVLFLFVRDRRAERRDFLSSLESEREVVRSLTVAIQRQSGLLLVISEIVAPGRSEAIHRKAKELFQQPVPNGPRRFGHEDDEA